MYKTLDQWFGSPIKTNNTITAKIIFYFDSITMQSKWLHEKPKDIRFTTVIKWNKARSSLQYDDEKKQTHSVMPIEVCTNLKQTHKYLIPIEKTYSKRHITYLKSNLQKCIRRQLSEKAIKTAYHMIKVDLNEFLRRLCIIVFEDVKLHESYSTLVWLMVATSKQDVIFRPTKEMIDWLLGLVNTLCNINEADEADESEEKYKLTDFNEYDLLYSLQLRMSYGGMRGDVEMLDDFTTLWYNRFRKNIPCDKTQVNLIDSDTIRTLTFNDWKLEGENMSGIDYHCAPQIAETLAKEYNCKEYEVKSAIWNCSSGINKRKPNHKSDKNIEVWNKIELRFYEHQANLLRKYIK